MKNSTQGFTLIELLIVIAIIGILAAVLIPNLLGARKRAYDTSAASCAKSIQTQQAQAQIDFRHYVTFTKTAGQTAVTVTDSLTPAGDVTDYPGDLNAACNASEAVITSSGVTSTGYTVTVNDTRGSQTYTITPTGMTNARTTASN